VRQDFVEVAMNLGRAAGEEKLEKRGFDGLV